MSEGMGSNANKDQIDLDAYLVWSMFHVYYIRLDYVKLS